MAAPPVSGEPAGPSEPWVPGIRERTGRSPTPGPAGTGGSGFAQATPWVHLPGDTEPDALGWLGPLLRRANDQNG